MNKITQELHDYQVFTRSSLSAYKSLEGTGFPNQFHRKLSIKTSHRETCEKLGRRNNTLEKYKLSNGTTLLFTVRGFDFKGVAVGFGAAFIDQLSFHCINIGFQSTLNGP